MIDVVAHVSASEDLRNLSGVTTDTGRPRDRIRTAERRYATSVCVVDVVVDVETQRYIIEIESTIAVASMKHSFS